MEASPSIERVLATARTLFFANGFEGVTTDRLAREASVSKATIYKAFPSMAALFTAVVEREVERFEGDGPVEFDDLDGLRDCLVGYGVRLLTFLNEPDAVAFSRIMGEQARQHPDTARRFVDAAYERTVDSLQAIIERAQGLNLLRSEHSARAVAEAFAGALEGFGLVRAHHGISSTPYPDAERAACLAATMVIDGMGKNGS